MPQSIRKTRRRPPGPELPPARRADVPAFLGRLYGVTVAPSELQVLGDASDLQMLGLAAAHADASKRSIDRGAPAAVARALALVAAGKEMEGELALRKARRLEARALTRAPLPKWHPLVRARFLWVLQRENSWHAAGEAPPGADLPFDALVLVAWWCGYLPTRPTPDGIRSLRRLVARYGRAGDLVCTCCELAVDELVTAPRKDGTLQPVCPACRDLIIEGKGWDEVRASVRGARGTVAN